MIITTAFPGDINAALKEIQHNLYQELLPELVRFPRKRYLRAVRLVGIQTELSEILTDLDTFDHRAIQAVHDTIAAYFRFAHDRRGQLPLPIADTSYTEQLKQSWRAFYHREVARLTQYDDFVRAILTAVAPTDPFERQAAQDTLADILEGEYDLTIKIHIRAHIDMLRP